MPGVSSIPKTHRSFRLLLIAAAMILLADTARAQPVTLTSDARLESASIDILFTIEICEPDFENCEFYDFRGFVDQFGATETVSPAFNALLAANPNIRTSLSYDAATKPSANVNNQFEASSLTYQLRDPSSGDTVNSSTALSNVALFNAGTNTTSNNDSLIGFGTVQSGITGFAEITDMGEPEFFSFDPINSYVEGPSGLPFEDVLGPDISHEIQESFFFEGILPETYESSFSSLSYTDSNGQLLSSANDTFSLPIADLDNIDGGFAALGFVGDAGGFGGEEFELSDGRVVFVNPQFIELNAFYRTTTSIATTTPESVLHEFDRTGTVPLSNLPGTFVLPDVMGEPNEAEPILIDDEQFTLGDNFFFNETSMQQRMVFDPEVAIGYEYEITGVEDGSGFADIRVPTVGGDNEFQIAVFDPNSGEYLEPITLMAGETFDHTAYDFDVTRFAILGIDTSEMVSPDDGMAFPALIGFTGTGTGTLRQTPLVVDVPEGCAIPEGGIWGDLDSNGTVEFADFLTLSGNYGKSVLSYAEGDIDCNGTVEFADFLNLSGNFGKSVAATQSVPEPSSSLLAICGLAFISCFRTRLCGSRHAG